MFKLVNNFNLKFVFQNARISNTFKCCKRHLNQNGPVQLSFMKIDPPNKEPEVNHCKPPILIQHGLFGSKENWRSLSKVIAMRCERTVYSCDVRNHGDSPHSDHFDYLTMAEDIKHLMQATINVPQATLIGHSLGGRAMFQFAVLYPDLVEQLVLVDIHPTERKEEVTMLLDHFPDILQSALDQVICDNPQGLTLSKARSLIDQQLRTHVQDQFLRQFFLMSLTERNKQIVWKFNLKAIKHLLSSRNIEKIDARAGFPGPTLSVYGQKSEFMADEFRASFLKICPNTRFESIENAGHYLHVTHPQPFLDHVIGFINKQI